MPQSRREWHERLKTVEREHRSSRLAVDRPLFAAERDPTTLGNEIKPRDLEAASQNLDGTYLVRMFSEFETAVRSYWRTVKLNSHPPTQILLDHVGAKRQVPADVIAEVHIVRAIGWYTVVTMRASRQHSIGRAVACKSISPAFRKSGPKLA